MSGLLGCIIVTQPSEISAIGMTRTIDFLRHKEIPIMGLVIVSLLRPSDTPVALPQARYGEGGQGLRCAFLDIHSTDSGCGAIETLLRQTGEDGLEGATHYTQETNPVAESSGKGWRIGSNNCCQVHVR